MAKGQPYQIVVHPEKGHKTAKVCRIVNGKQVCGVVRGHTQEGAIKKALNLLASGAILGADFIAPEIVLATAAAPTLYEVGRAGMQKFKDWRERKKRRSV